ncbi:tyrosine-type recombinase/integrase [Micrococcus luteus]|uniref:tyrosine-type recombinase/integrase n=1 Tax=Micrococcus luteus TaxID=1270 RepID=UPI00203F3677|nr:tyrosine-type recombinase/integrase [Micrococcus luteus]MCM3577457.1 tyrosine-type recombinase/integrase [Micrococcus luteus]
MTRTWDEALNHWTAWLRAADRASGTIKLRQSQVRRLAADVAPLGPWDVTADDLVAWLGRPGWSADTRRSHRAAVRTFYGWATSTGRLTVDPAAALPSVKARPGRPRPAAEDVIADALAAADERDALMIRLGAHAGLRACEIATLHSRRLRRDLDGWTVTVLGKGGKVRDVPLSAELAGALRARPPGWAFPGRQDGHLSAAYVSRRLSWALGAGTTGHQLRHRFGSAAYRGERDLRAVQVLLGHASVATTQLYVAVPDGALRRAVLAAA